MTVEQTWSVYCQGKDRSGGVEFNCRAWIGHAPTPDEAKAVARTHGWLTAEVHLCPRHRKQAKR